MRAALLFILFFLAHVGRSPAEAHSSGPGGCSALTGHGVGSYDERYGYWKLEHDGGSSVSPNDRVVVRLSINAVQSIQGIHLQDLRWDADSQGCHEHSGRFRVRWSNRTHQCGRQDEVEAYLDLPSTTGTVTVTAEIVYSKMSVSMLTLDIEVVEAWTQVGDDIDGSWNAIKLGYSVSMNTDGTRMAVGAPSSCLPI